MCGTKLSQHEPHGPTSGRKLSLFTRNGSIWRFFYMQGEFCTVVTAKKLSRENFVPNVRQSWGSPTGHQAPPVWRVPEGPVWRARAGFEAQPGRGAGGRWWSPAAVSTNNSSTQPKQISHAIPPRHGSMHAQKPQNINDQTSTLEIHSGELHAKLVGEWPVGQQAASRRRACPLSARSAAAQRLASGPVSGSRAARGASSSVTPAGLPAQRPVSGRSALGQRSVSARSAAREWPVGPQAASRRRACPLSGRSAPAQRLASGPAVPRPRIFSRSASPSEPYQTGMDSGTVHRASGTMASKLP